MIQVKTFKISETESANAFIRDNYVSPSSVKFQMEYIVIAYDDGQGLTGKPLVEPLISNINRFKSQLLGQKALLLQYRSEREKKLSGNDEQKIENSILMQIANINFIRDQIKFHQQVVDEVTKNGDIEIDFVDKIDILPQINIHDLMGEEGGNLMPSK